MSSAREDFTLFGLLNFLLRHRYLVVALPLVAASVAFVWAVLTPSEVASESLLMAQHDQAQSRFRGVASQLGLALPGQDQLSPETYATLLESRELTSTVAGHEFVVITGGDTLRGTFAELYEEMDEGKDEVETSLDLISARVEARVDPRTNLVVLRTEGRWPDLAVGLNRRLIERLNEFNVHQRQSQAKAERIFVEARLEEARQELLQAEREVADFLERNRRYQESPTLSFEMARLQRRVSIQQQVYAALAESFEQARIEEVRATPVITVIQSPEHMITGAAPGPVRMALLAGLVAFAAGFVLALLIEYALGQAGLASEDYLEFRDRLRRLVGRSSDVGEPSPTASQSQGDSQEHIDALQKVES